MAPETFIVLPIAVTGAEFTILEPLLVLLLIDLMLKSTSYWKLLVFDLIMLPLFPWLVEGGGGIEATWWRVGWLAGLLVGVSLVRMRAALVFFMKWSKVVSGLIWA